MNGQRGAVNMAKISKELLVELEGLINTAAGHLPKVEAKQMFGCHGLVAEDEVFGLVWKEGRIGVRIPDEKEYKRLMSLKGSSPWKAGDKTMSKWVLIPPSYHYDIPNLAKLLEAAHEMATKKDGKKPTKKKSAPKKSNSKKLRKAA